MKLRRVIPIRYFSHLKKLHTVEIYLGLGTRKVYSKNHDNREKKAMARNCKRDRETECQTLELKLRPRFAWSTRAVGYVLIL